MHGGPPGGGTWTGVAVTLCGIALGLATAFAVPPLREAILDALHGDTESVREDLRALGAAGILLVVWLALIHTVVWYPAEILDAAAGFVYGFGPALPLVMASWVASGVLAYWIGQHTARPLLYRFAGEDRFRRLERAVHDGGATLLIAMRLIPIVPFSLFSSAAGAAQVPLWRFIWTTAVGYLPITAIFIYLGSQLEELSPTDPLLWACALALLAMLFAIRFVRPRIQANQAARPEPRSGNPPGSG